jgi:hypothetical protein
VPLAFACIWTLAEASTMPATERSSAAARLTLERRMMKNDRVLIELLPHFHMVCCRSAESWKSGRMEYWNNGVDTEQLPAKTIIPIFHLSNLPFFHYSVPR